jgi:hypothetical protein
VPITDPTDIPGLSGWWRAESLTGGTADGGSPATWTDLSGNARHLSRAGAPVLRHAHANGLAAVEFDGVGDSFSVGGFPLPEAFTWAFVVEAAAATTTDHFAGTSGIPGLDRHANVRFRQGLFVDGMRFGSGGAVTSVNYVYSRSWNIVVVRGGAADVEAFANGLGEGARAVTDPNDGTGTLRLGAVLTDFFAGHVAEMVFYGRGVSKAERNDLEALWATQYGVAVRADPYPAEPMWPVTAPDARGAFGVMLRDQVEWEWDAAAALGARYVRFHPGWGSIETAPGVYSSSTSGLELPLAYAAARGIAPIVVTGYGSPETRLTPDYTVASAVAPAATAIPLVEATAAIVPHFAHVLRASGAQIVATGKWTYSGALVHAVDHGTRTITLASATTVALAAGDKLRVNALFYESVETTDPDQASVTAWKTYVEHVASRVAAHAPAGRVELWNEPPWTNDRWDVRYAQYDAGTAPAELENMGQSTGLFYRILRDTTPPPGVTFVSSMSHKSGFNSLLSTAPTEAMVTRTGMQDAIHPYAPTPEGHGWRVWLPGYPILVGENASSNFQTLAWNHRQHEIDHGWKPDLTVTEVGEAMADQTAKARQYLRTYLSFLGAGVRTVVFYILTNTDVNQTCFMNQTTREPLTAYYRMQSFLRDLDTLPAAPLAYAEADLPRVAAVAGNTYPVMEVPIVGRPDASAAANTYLLAVWQRTHPASWPTSASAWAALPAPGPATVTVPLPDGYAGATARNLTTRNTVLVTLTEPTPGEWVATLPVQDDPVLLRVTEELEFPAVPNGVALWRRGGL